MNDPQILGDQELLKIQIPACKTATDKSWRQNDERKIKKTNSKQAKANITSDNKPVPDVTSYTPSLMDAVHQYHDGIDVLESVHNRYMDNNMFQRIITHPKEHKNFESIDGLLYIKHQDNKCLCIPDMLIEGRQLREIIITEAHSLLAHLSMQRTLAYLRDYVWWKTIA
ncbi:hypothetical protein P691DRAFT_685009 [Macrolepiota fuliginosa MF-IS2]|uniref:Integrase zinc-binding domain-containing protein n=1 Tax=Macrolepiota fuliginosa MF-IS2 TaxID=1400762 RepID=A0A9P6BX56_9AGAR|nr:hypothetical protein P691DRAFT_685009 [Macrolepiota fuliginosa MF-IS2]